MELPRIYVSWVLSTARTQNHLFVKTCLAQSSGVYHSLPLVGVVGKILAIGAKFNQTSIAGPLGGAVRSFGSGHHRS
jgi:hypothetical protein